ncbi:uncharacterized protein BDV17DRAFT_294831 [Aspergillus undulatus]|uniref:uncharacterized protein n=1 Tax=Aspergillus undulatus TaxID=1810928 RepID=UPI003CCDEAF0
MAGTDLSDAAAIESSSTDARSAKRHRSEGFHGEPSAKRQAVEIAATQAVSKIDVPAEEFFNIGEFFDFETASTGAPAMGLPNFKVTSILKQPFNIEELPNRLPEIFIKGYLSRNCIQAFPAAVSMIKVMWREREERYVRLCPKDNNQVRYFTHTSSIERLRQWERNYKSGQDKFGRDSAPPPKLSRDGMHMHFSRAAYENWTKTYDKAMLANSKGRPWTEYHDAKDALRRIIDGPKPGSVSDEVWAALRRFLEDMFLTELQKWGACFV